MMFVGQQEVTQTKIASVVHIKMNVVDAKIRSDVNDINIFSRGIYGSIACVLIGGNCV